MADTVRGQLLEDARDATEKDRNNNYGEPKDNFKHTADLLNAYYAGLMEFSVEDVAIIQMIVKLSRLWTDTSHRDSWLDIAGYAACGWECAA